MASSTVILNESFTEAWETVQTALALGMRVEAPAGLVMYKVTLFSEGGDPWDLGYYSTEAAAKTRLRNWVLENYGDLFRECLREEDGQRETTDMGIINWHFTDVSENVYEIEEVTVLPTPQAVSVEEGEL